MYFRVVSWISVVLSILLAPVAAQRGRQLEGLDRAAELVRDGRLADAERQLAAVLKAAPNEAGALNLLGAIRAQQGKLDEAEALFLKAVRSDAGFAGPHMNLAFLYKLKGLPEKTIVELKEVLRLEPNNVDAADKLARLLLAEGRVDDGIALLESAKQRQAPAALLVLLGDAYASKGNWGKAEESYLQALDRDASDPGALLGMARMSQKKGDAGAASAYLSRARSVAPDSADFLRSYALAALETGLDDEAREALVRATALDPANSPVLLLLGVAWLRKPDLDAAELSFRKLLALRPDDAQGQLFLGYVLLKAKRLPEARELLERSVAADAGAPEGLYYLGLIAQEQQEDARAVEILQQVVQKFPTYSHAHVALGVSYMRLKDYARARQELELAAKLSPDNQKAHYNLALLYARLKEPERAQEEMRVVENLKSRDGARDGEDEISTPPVPGPR